MQTPSGSTTAFYINNRGFIIRLFDAFKLSLYDVDIDCMINSYFRWLDINICKTLKLTRAFDIFSLSLCLDCMRMMLF